MWGKLVSMSMNVAVPYSGSTTNVSFNPTGQFHYSTIQADGSVFDYAATINLSAAGQRVVTPTSVTGQQLGDTGLSVPEAVWFSGIMGPYMNTNISAQPTSAWPAITIEIVTNQGVVANWADADRRTDRALPSIVGADAETNQITVSDRPSRNAGRQRRLASSSPMSPRTLSETLIALATPQAS